MRRRIVILLYFFIVGIHFLHAQTHHYWTEQFGTTSSFLGGATFAGAMDNSCVYYNPSAMGRIQNPNLSINVDAYRLRNTKVQNALGTSHDVKETRFLTIPNLIAGVLPLSSDTGKFRLGYALITKSTYNSKFDYLANNSLDVIASQPGLENHITSFELQHQNYAFSAGFAGSYTINDQWSVGISHFFDFQNVRYKHSMDVKVIPESFSPENLLQSKSEIDLEYWNVSGSATIGVHYNSEKLKLGLIWRIPSYNIVGKAKNYRDYSVTNLYSAGVDSSFSIIDDRQNMQVLAKNNGSIGVGVQWQISRKLLLNFSQELFFPVRAQPLYEVNGSPERYPSTVSNADIQSLIGDRHFLAYEQSRKWVYNVGVGLKVNTTDRLDLFFATRTDFTYKNDEVYENQSIYMIDGNYNLLHFTFGTSYRNYNQKRYDIGVEVGTSISGDKSNWSNINDPSVTNHLVGVNEQNMKYKVLLIRLLVGITLDFNKKKQSSDL